MTRKLNRRELIRGAAATAVLGSTLSRGSSASVAISDEAVGVLVDTTLCIGCRRCEAACAKAHGFEPPSRAELEDPRVFDRERRPGARSLTVVNRHPSHEEVDRPAYVKLSCMHCLEPACVSACLVSAMQKRPEGPVVYDPSRCMGCRYCMVACPFELPAFDYDMPLTPQVRKCDLCAQDVPSKYDRPACVRACPVEALTYGRRSDLLGEAQSRIRRHPDRYHPHIYGETEAGGTSVLYLTSLAPAELGLWALPPEPPGQLTETIQHGIFKKFGPPLLLYGLLGIAMRVLRPRADEEGGPPIDERWAHSREEEP